MYIHQGIHQDIHQGTHQGIRSSNHQGIRKVPSKLVKENAIYN